ncbi:MAG: Fe-S-containing hydro-lyase [Coriobacteriaceae bacterium]|nr:Fe-S-containing hydro-lyase [Coriobacteriaceae bacterium]
MSCPNETVKRISGTIDAETARSLRAGDQVLYTGKVYTARDAAHARLIELMDRGEELPFDIRDAIIYYAGPAPARPGMVMGSVGPTTAYRMDPYAPRLLDAGQRAMIGKGARGQAVIDAMKRNDAVYFAAVGGIAALMAQSVKDVQLVCYEDLGTEAIRLLTVEDMPLTVAIDCQGNSIYDLGPAAYLAQAGFGE